MDLSRIRVYFEELHALCFQMIPLFLGGFEKWLAAIAFKLAKIPPTPGTDRLVEAQSGVSGNFSVFNGVH